MAGVERRGARTPAGRRAAARGPAGARRRMSGRYTEPDFAAAALITIDTQRDVLDGGALEIPGTSAILPQMIVLLGCFRELGAPIVHILRLYRPDGSNADLCRRSMLERGAPVLHPGVDGTQLA